MEFFVGTKDFDHQSVPKVGVLIANLGTPDAPTAKALRPYLREFLGDPRVIELWKPYWQVILNAFILPFRPRKSAKLYKSVWTEQGSPLLVTSYKQREKIEARLKDLLGTPIVVDLGMRYGSHSIAEALERMRQQDVRRILFVPMYPQYSGTTTASTFDAVVDTLKTWRWVPELRTLMQYHDHEGYIEALANSVREVWKREGGKAEKLVTSYHGIPTRYFLNGDPYHCHCYKTTRLLAEKLGLSSEEYIVTFQSQFGKEPWLEPKTDATLERLAHEGIKRVDVMCPGFSADCLETIEEINEENREIFIEGGGEQFRYIPALNDRDDFIEALSDLLVENMQGWVVNKSEYDSTELLASLNETKCRYRAMNEG